MSGPRAAVSACLLGERCRYDGRSNRCQALLDLLDAYDVEATPVCPEVEGGLPVPRECSERKGPLVVTRGGADVTAAFAAGAAKALERALSSGCSLAVLKARSPSCGKGAVYDGTFTHTQIPGDGVFAAALGAEGVEIYTEEELDAFRRRLEALRSR